MKFWHAASLVGGTLDASHPEAAAEYIAQAAWLAPEGLHGIVHLPLRQMEFS